MRPWMSLSRRTLATGALLFQAFILGACGAPAPDGTSGVEGRVWLGPMCPVVIAGTECPDQPYQAMLDVLDPEGDVVASVESDEAGRYRVALGPGAYTLSPRPPSSGMPFAAAVTFTVSEGQWTVVDVHYDSGIR